jgi:molybdopterin/thiamine biosynthesis adenylyltransferase
MTTICQPANNPLVAATNRQELLPWWNQPRISKVNIHLVGAGGLGSNIALPLTQQGIGSLTISEHDRVDFTNLSRQFYTSEDVGEYKAHALAKRLLPHATAPTVIRGYAAPFEASHLDQHTDLIICGVDNDAANIDVARAAIEKHLPVVFVNVSSDGEACRIFIQVPGGACFACYKPAALIPKPPQPCIPTPAIVDILHIAAGLAIRAATTLLLGDSIGDYNCRDFTMSGIDFSKTVPRRQTCPLCNPTTR